MEGTKAGPVHFVRSAFDAAHRHGAVPASSALQTSAPLLARLALDPALGDVEPARMLFIDTETTGLSTGAGTVPFLVGVGFFSPTDKVCDDPARWKSPGTGQSAESVLHIEQMFLAQRHQEPAMLRTLAEHIERASMVVSYNGKSFDWPLLRSRFVLNRVPTPKLPPHLDLLHCARRAFKRRLSSMRLMEMERQILDFHRVDDVGGAAIPRLYLNYLRTQYPEKLDGVIEHNVHDLVALAAFLGEILRRFRQVQQSDDPRDHLSYALIAEKAGDGARAKAFAEACATAETLTESPAEEPTTISADGADALLATRIDALLLRARVARRERDVASEGQALRDALELLSNNAPDDGTDGACSVHLLRRALVHLELAKHMEHRRKDLVQALHHAAQTQPAETAEEQRKRSARLRRRLTK